MSIIVHAQTVTAQMACEAGVLSICFADSAYVRADEVLVADGRVSILFAQGHYEVGALPAGIAAERLSRAVLSSGVSALHLPAPIKVIAE